MDFLLQVFTSDINNVSCVSQIELSGSYVPKDATVRSLLLLKRVVLILIS